MYFTTIYTVKSLNNIPVFISTSVYTGGVLSCRFTDLWNPTEQVFQEYSLRSNVYGSWWLIYTHTWHPYNFV